MLSLSFNNYLERDMDYEEDTEFESSYGHTK